LIRLWFVASRQQSDTLRNPRPTVLLVFLTRRHEKRLAGTLLRQADQPPVSGPAPIKTRDNKAAHILEIHDLDLGHICPHCAAEELVLDTTRRVDSVRQHAKLGLQDMGRRRHALVAKPCTIVAQLRGLLLCARNGNAEIVVFIKAKRCAGQIAQHGGDLSVCHPLTLKLANLGHIT